MSFSLFLSLSLSMLPFLSLLPHYTSASRSPGFDPHFRNAEEEEDPHFSHWTFHLGPSHSHTSDLKTGIPVATLPGTKTCWFNTGTGWSHVCTLWLGQTTTISVCQLWAHQSLRYTILLLGQQQNLPLPPPPFSLSVSLIWQQQISLCLCQFEHHKSKTCNEEIAFVSNIPKAFFHPHQWF